MATGSLSASYPSNISSTLTISVRDEHDKLSALRVVSCNKLTTLGRAGLISEVNVAPADWKVPRLTRYLCVGASYHPVLPT